MRRRTDAVPRGVSQITPIFVDRAEGALIEDVDGNRLIDFAGGIGCLNAGHRAPDVVAALRRQLDRFLHTCFMVTPYEGYVKLAEKLNAAAPGDFPKKTLLLNSGAEAVENAVKIARAYTRRPAIICFEDAFHGRTLLTMSLTSKTHPYKAGFEPFASDIYRVPYAYCYRCSYGLTYPSCAVHCAHHLEDTFTRVVAAESVAALIVEPVLGEGGFVTPPPEFLSIVQEICRRHGIVFVADEVQTGFGRTGSPVSTMELRLIFWSPPRASGAVCRWPRSRAAPRSWTTPGQDRWAEPSEEIRWRARRLWRCSMRWRVKNSPTAPRDWANGSPPARATGRSAGRLWVRFAAWAPCRPLNLCARKRRASLLLRKPNTSRVTATSTG